MSIVLMWIFAVGMGIALSLCLVAFLVVAVEMAFDGPECSGKVVTMLTAGAIVFGVPATFAFMLDVALCAARGGF